MYDKAEEMTHTIPMINYDQTWMVQVREWKLQDAHALLEIGKDPQFRKAWNDTYPYPFTLSRAKLCTEAFLHANPLRRQICAITVNHRLCGLLTCEKKAFQSAYLTYFLQKEYQLEAILQEAILQMCIYCFAHMDVLTIYAKVSLHDLRTRMALLENSFTESRETAPIYLYYLHRQIHTSDWMQT